MPYKYFGLLAVAMLVCGLGFIIWRWPQGKHHTFSYHVATDKYKMVYYVVLFALTAPVLLGFFFGWFIPAFHLPPAFGVCLIISIAAQQACTLIPEVGGWKTICHGMLAGLAGGLLLPLLFMLLSSGYVSLLGKFLTAFCLFTMLGVIGATIAFRGRHYALILQSVYYTAFFVPVLGISYVL